MTISGKAVAPETGMFQLPGGKSVKLTFALVSSLFLLWGFCNGMIDVMDKHFQETLHLSLSQSANVQWAHYLGYFLMALPAGWLATRLGYRAGIICGLLLVAVGGLWFIPATHIGQFWAFLLGVCCIAAGLTFLETIANPYTTVLGSPRFAATRINLAQSCNGIGWIFGPIAGSLFFYGKNEAGVSTGSQTLWIPYCGVAVVVILLAIVFAFADVPDVRAEDDYQIDKSTPTDAAANPSLWLQPHFLLAIASQFLYVAAQSGIFAFFINYMTRETPSISESLRSLLRSGAVEQTGDTLFHFSNSFASILASVGFVLFLAGRFSGAILLKKIPAHKMLGIYALINIVLCLLIVFKLGWISVAAVFLTYFFMSIMFPTIFALGIFGLGSHAKTASSFIVMAIMGGAIVPKFMGFVADKKGISSGFLVPAVCFAFVALYGFLWPTASGFESMLVSHDRSADERAASLTTVDRIRS